jgi:hypothetical protein
MSAWSLMLPSEANFISALLHANNIALIADGVSVDTFGFHCRMYCLIYIMAFDFLASPDFSKRHPSTRWEGQRSSFERVIKSKRTETDLFRGGYRCL